MKQSHPMPVVEDVYHFDKFDTHLSKKLLTWSWIQLTILLAMVMDLFFRFGDIGFPGVLWYGLYIFISIFCITSLMDKVPYAPIAEIVRFVLIIMFLVNGDWNWFGNSPWTGIGANFVFTFSLSSIALAFYFHFAENRYYNKEIVTAR